MTDDFAAAFDLARGKPDRIIDALVEVAFDSFILVGPGEVLEIPDDVLHTHSTSEALTNGIEAVQGNVINVLAVPLSLFLLGLFLTLIAAARLLYLVVFVVKGKSPTMGHGWNWFKIAIEKHQDTLHLTPIFFFFFGCVSGVGIIAWA